MTSRIVLNLNGFIYNFNWVQRSWWCIKFNQKNFFEGLFFHYFHVYFPQLGNDPADAPDGPALSGVISDLIFTFTPDCVRRVGRVTVFRNGIRSRRNNLLKYRPIPPLTGGNFLLWSVILTSNKSVLRKVRLETKLSLFEFPWTPIPRYPKSPIFFRSVEGAR